MGGWHKGHLIFFFSFFLFLTVQSISAARGATKGREAAERGDSAPTARSLSACSPLKKRWQEDLLALGRDSEEEVEGL